MDFETWDQVEKDLEPRLLDMAISGGSDILRFQQQKVEEMTREARTVDLAGHTVPVVNCPYNFGSLVGEALLKKFPSAEFSGYYFTRADGKEQWGLRSNGFDVSEIAKLFGGGEHQQAAGFVKER